MRVDPIKRNEEELRRVQLRLDGYKRKGAIFVVCVVVYYFFIKLIFL